MPPSPSSGPRLGAAAVLDGWLAQRVVASVALVACVWSVPYLPTNDGPQVALASHIQNHYADPGSIFPDQVVPNFAFTHLAFSLLFTPLEAVLPWRDALRLTLSVSALGMAWAFGALVAAVDARRRPLGLLGFVFAMTWSFYMGFFSYEIATALGLALVGGVAHASGARPIRGLRAVLVGVGLFVVAVAHVFAAAWTGLAIGCVLVGRARPGERSREAIVAALIGLPALGLFAAAWSEHGDLAHVALTGTFRWVPPIEQIVRLPGLVLPGSHIRSWIVVLGIVAALGSALVRWKTASALERSLAVLGLSLLAAGLLAPLDVPGWQSLSPRFLAPVPAFAVALIPFERLDGSPRRPLVLGAIAAATLASLASSRSLHRRLYAGCADVLAGLDDAVKRTGYVLPVVLDPYCGVARSPDESEVPYLAPARHLGALYALAQGGSIPYLFAGSSAAYAFRLRDTPDPHAPGSIPSVERYWSAVESTAFHEDAAFRRQVVTELAVHGTSYEAVVAFGTEPRDVAVFDELGYAPEHSQGALLMARFRGCKGALRLSAARAHTPLHFAWGTAALAKPIVDEVLPAARAGASGVLVVPLAHVLCGRLWARLEPVGLATNPGSTLCEGADDSGRIYATFAPSAEGLIDCARVPGP